MKKTLLLFLGLFSAGWCYSQSASPSVIASNGDHIDAGSFQLDYTVGEVIIETVYGDSLTLTQGFHQPNLLTAPSNGSSTVSCPAAAVNPGAPSNITDACGRTVSAILVGQDASTPSCTVLWRYRYTACDGSTTADWTYTYTIERQPFTDPTDGGSTVGHPDNTDISPALPVVTDNCGNVLTPGVPVISPKPACGGARTYTYLYTDCEGNLQNWVFTYTVTCISISGKLIWSRDLSIGVGKGTVTLRNTANNAVLGTKLTPADGLYKVTASNLANGAFSVKPVKNMLVTNGLTSADVLRISQHVLGSNRFTDPFDLVAADVNRNNTVSTQDASLLNAVILGNPQAFLQFNTSWRFIPGNHKLPTNPAPAKPLNPVPAGFWTFPEQLNYTGINSDQIDYDFVGIKLGDVNTPNANPDNRGLKPLIWKVEDQELAVGSDILVSFNAEGFRYLAALQFALGFNTGYLEYKGVQTSARMPLNQTHFGAYNAAAGELRTSWYSTATVSSVRNGLTVFQLQFKVLKAGAKLSDVLYLDTNLLLAEAYSEELVPRGILLEFTQGSKLRDISAETTVTAQDRLLQNQPNPFGTSTQIYFELGEACEAVLSVYDASGRLLWEDRAYREAGRHSVTYRSAEGQAPGILYYTLRTPGATLTQKMVMVRQE